MYVTWLFIGDTLYKTVKKCNLLQSNDSTYSWQANIFYFYIYEW
jgi:hypothetical protein